jgi:hypothetical protein
MFGKIERRMTPEESYAWQEEMDEKYELVDGALKLSEVDAGLTFRPTPKLIVGDGG